jgi:hypothetical protein
MTNRAAPLLLPEHVAWINAGVSGIVASRSATSQPSIARALALSMRPDGRKLTALLRPDQSRELLSDLQAGRPMAIVLSQPSTNRTLQLKASRARVRSATAYEQAAQPAYVAAMQREIGSLGYPPEFVAALLHVAQPQELVAVEIAPEQAFDQTPGPRAGSPLRALEGST